MRLVAILGAVLLAGQAGALPPPIVAAGSASRTATVQVDRPSATVRGRTFLKPLLLSEFLLAAEEGDHHIVTLGVEANGLRGSPARMELKPGIGECISPSGGGCREHHIIPYRYQIGMQDPGLSVDDYMGSVRSAPSECDGSCALVQPINPAGHRPVLSGFWFRREEGAYVRRVSVLPERRNVLVRFQDRREPRFRAEVSVTWLPERVLDGPLRDVTLQFRPGRPAPEAAVGGGPIALVGFDFEFKNGDHKLKRIGFERRGSRLIPRFSDQNLDDPWQVRILYYRLKSS